MLNSKAQNFFAILNDFSLTLARTSSTRVPLTVEDVLDCPLTAETDEIWNEVCSFAGLQKGQYVQAICGVWPDDRFIRRATLENPAKTRDPAFLPKYLSDQFKIDVATNVIAALHAKQGHGFSPDRGPVKELVFCGAPRHSIVNEQARLVSMGVFPSRLEIASMATIGGTLDLMAAMGESMPSLILEIDSDNSTVLICSDQQLDVARPIPHGFNSMYPVVQKELGLKDEASARKLFTSSTFDFTEMGSMLLKKLMKELQASTGFYEVQTGQTIGHLLVSMLPENLSWIPTTLSRTLGVDVLKPDFGKWLERQSITLGPTLEVDKIKTGWTPLFGLMADFTPASKN